MLGYLLIGATVKKVVGAVKKADEAERIFDRASDDYVYAYRAYLREQKRASRAVNDLTQWQLMASENEIQRFVTAYKRISRMDYKEVTFGDVQKAAQLEPDMQILELAVGSVVTFVKDNLFMGLALAGISMNMRAEKIMNDALTAQNLSKAAVLKIEDEMEQLYLIRTVTMKLHSFLRKLLRICRGPLEEMEEIVDRKQNWREYTLEEKEVVAATVKLMQLIKTLIAARVVTEDGRVNPDMEELLESEDFENALNSYEEEA